MNYFLAALKKYVVFSGRARRKEFWYYSLFSIILLILAIVLDNVLGTTMDPLPYGAFYVLIGLAMFLPGLSVSIRRLHDVGKSGWFYLIGVIPIIGSIWLLILFLTGGDPGDNEYGADPKAVEA